MPQDLNLALQNSDRFDAAHLLRPVRHRPVGAEISATKYIGRVRGGTQACRIQCSDGADYIVKFLNNPQGKRILANDLLGTLLARVLCLPTAEPAIINVSKDFLQTSSEMVFHLGRRNSPMQFGRCFGSRIPRYSESATLRAAQLEVVNGVLPSTHLRTLGNVQDVAGMLVFDKWTCNTDARQTIVVQGNDPKIYTALMIDQGCCFNGSEWNFPDAPLRSIGLYGVVCDQLPSFASFEPWLDRLEHGIDQDILATLAREVPPEWYEDAHDAMLSLLERLDWRRLRIMDLVYSVWKNHRTTFPHRISSRNCNSNRCAEHSLQMSFSDLGNW